MAKTLDQIAETVPGMKRGKQPKGKIVDRLPEAKPAAAAAAPKPTTTGPDLVLADLPAIPLALDELQRHPDNRRPSPDAVAKMAATLEAEGLLEPIAVRRLADGRLEILSGETRYLAAERLGWPTIAGRVIPDCDEVRALRLLAVFNAERKDLDPIEKARLIVRLCDPVEKGGGGMTRDAAGRIYDLKDGASASNLVRLLELPEEWQARVASGELPQSFARLLLPIAHAPRLLAAADEDYVKAHKAKADTWDRENWETRDALEGFLDDLIRTEIRPIDKKTKHTYFGDHYGAYPCLFTVTDELRESLDVVKLTIDGKAVEVATNAAAYDKLQLPLIAAKKRGDAKGKASKSVDDDEEAAKPRSKTPAEVKAAKKKAAEQLVARLDGWRSRWIKSLIAPRLGAGNDCASRMAAAIMLGGYSDHHRRLSDCLERTIEEVGVGDRTGGLADAWSTLGKTAAKLQGKIDASVSRFDYLVTAALKQLLAEEDRDPRRPLLEFEFVDAVAAELSIDLVAEWRKLQNSDRQLFSEFLTLHTGEQLDELASEWGAVVEGKPKAIKIQILSVAGKPFPLPESIKPIEGAKRKRGAK